MNWTVHNITTQAFTPYDHDTLGKKSNGHNTFVRCAHAEYRASSLEEKEAVVLRVIGVRYNVTDVVVRKVVDMCWRNMDGSLKESWDQRSNQLNAHHVPGQFVNLPVSVSDPGGFLCKFLREETTYVWKSFQKALCIKGGRKLHMKTIHMPLPQKTGSLAFRVVMTSPWFRMSLVDGKDLFPCEKIKMSSAGASIYHFGSKKRLSYFFNMDDVMFPSHFDHKSGSTYYFTSLCMLKRVGSAQKVKAYGWSDNENTVTFIYRDTRTSTKLVTFPRPVFNRSTIVDENRKKKKSKWEYTYPKCVVDGLLIDDYMPASMYLSSKHMQNLKFLFARLCVNNSNDGVISIDIRHSS